MPVAVKAERKITVGLYRSIPTCAFREEQISVCHIHRQVDNPDYGRRKYL
jgi:hypothetical protein